MIRKIIFAFIFLGGSLSLAYNFMPEPAPPDHEKEWLEIYSHRPIPNHDVPYFLKPPGNLSAGDQPQTLANKYLINQVDHILQSTREKAKEVAHGISPTAAKALEKISEPKMQMETFSIKHDLRYDVPSNTALYVAESHSVNFMARHEVLANSDTMSLAYKIRSDENVGVRHSFVPESTIVFLEGMW